MNHVAAALLAFATFAGLPVRAAPQSPGPGVAIVDVPYVSQSEQLCGGAAAAMLMRTAGARGVYAEDFAALVDRAAGGIHTRDLAEALRDRGYHVTVSNGSEERIRQQLARGRAVLVLLEDRPGRYHYVVVVGWEPQAVTFHDPARAPFLTRTPVQFDAAWRVTDRWMLTIDAAPAIRDSAPTAGARDEAAVPSIDREVATRRFVERDYEEAARLAERAVATNPADASSWRLLGASRYLAGDEGGALDAWNRAGEPKLDLIRMEGLRRTPHRVAERLVGLSPGTTLTRSGLERANRRLALLPAEQTSRVSYTALPGSLAEVRGAVVERPLAPSRVEWIASAAGVPIDRELSVSAANLAGAGDRLDATWRFWSGRPRVGFDYGFPSLLTGGVWRLSSSWQEETYRDLAHSEVRAARVGWMNWLDARMRIDGGAEVARWTDHGTAALLDATVEYRPLNNLFSFEGAGSRTLGASRPFSTAGVAARWRVQPGVVQLSGSGQLSRVSSTAPADRWPGAGAGRARPLLLRAHPLLGANGRIDGPVFGRTVVQATLEAERDVLRRGLMTVGVAAFGDAARAWRRADGTSSPVHVDLGVGLRLRLAPGFPAIRLDVARGLRDGHVAFTAGWQQTWWRRARR